MLNKTIEKALNEQAHRELESFYLYLSMAQWLEKEGWRGFAHWMNAQAKEELEHGLKILGFINECDGRAVLSGMATPKEEWASVQQAMEEAYKHERFITSSIHEIVATARKEGDFATDSFLKWFVDEQVEEESSVLEILDMLKKVGDARHGMFMVDRQLANRGK